MTPTDNPELGLIGCCIRGGLDTAMDLVSNVKSEVFAREDCRHAFAVIESMTVAGQELNELTFRMRWKGLFTFPIPDPIIDAADSVQADLANYYLGGVEDSHKRRKLSEVGFLLQTKANDATRPIDELLSEAEAVLYGENVKGFPVIESKKACLNLLTDMQERFDNRDKLSGVPTGLPYLDAITNGLQFGEQSIIASRPSVGKTAIAINIISKACVDCDIPTLVITLEMSSQAIMRRLFSARMGVSMGELKSGQFTEQSLTRFRIFNEIMAKKPLCIVDCVSGIDSSRLAAVIRRAVRKYGIRFVVIDYLQKIQPGQRKEKRTYEVGQVSSTLKGLAASTNTAFLTLAQLSREPDKDKGRQPKLSDLADSAQIERDGDLIGMLHRARTKEDPTGKEAILIIAKQRDGECGMINLNFEGKFCKFTQKQKSNGNEDEPNNPHND